MDKDRLMMSLSVYGAERTIAKETKPQTLAAQPLPRLWYIAVMNRGIAAPDPDRMTVLAARADAT